MGYPVMRAHSIARTDSTDVWARLAQPLETRASSGTAGSDWLAKPAQSIGDAELVRRRLDATVPGEWELHVELQPVAETSRFVVKTRLVILGVSREDFGEGFSLSSASDDGLTKAARRFGIGVESTAAVETQPVPTTMGVADAPAVTSVDAELAAAFRSEPVKRRQKEPRVAPAEDADASPPPPAADASPSTVRKRVAKARSSTEHRPTISADEDFPSCPRCGDIMWDDRGAKKAEDAPDFRCRRRGCVGTLWVDRSTTPTTTTTQAAGSDEEFPF